MLPDIQDQWEPRGIGLDEVGIAGVRYPTTFSDGEFEQPGIASFDLTVELPGDRRGTHMSRMVELIHDHLQRLDPRELPTFLKAAATKLDVDSVYIRAALPIATEVTSPASGRSSWQPSDVRIRAYLREGHATVETEVTSEVTSLCPCSRAISDYGAHNQRSAVTLTVIGISDVPYPLTVLAALELIRSVGSCPIYPLIKRPDERSITMDAYDQPAFVEDMARDLSEACRAREVAHRVVVRNFESIHSHDAFAATAWSPDLQPRQSETPRP